MYKLMSMGAILRVVRNLSKVLLPVPFQLGRRVCQGVLHVAAVYNVPAEPIPEVPQPIRNPPIPLAEKLV